MSVRTHPSQWVSAQGQYAGSASRFAAYLIDLIASTVLYLLALAIISFGLSCCSRDHRFWLSSGQIRA